MGNCIGGGGQTSTSAQEAHRNVALEQELKNDAVETKKIHKLLLLGPGESGKSTFYKQMTLTRRGGFSAAEREQFAASIRQNLVSYLSEVARGAMGLGFMLEDDHKNFVRECEVVMEKYSELSEIPDFVSRAKALWRHESVQKAWENKSFFQVSDSLEYFMNKIDEVILDAYIPSDDDILRLRARTTGILQEEFSIEGEKFLIVDVGGQRSERRKWFKFFDNVTAVLYVAAIGEYDMTIWEDQKTNRITEALELFVTTSSNEAFKTTTFILFLNKDDIFREKLLKVPLSVCFPEYSGDNSYADASQFLADKFTDKFGGPDKKRLYVHFTCATDKGKVIAVFNSIRNTVIQESLGGAGLL